MEPNLQITGRATPTAHAPDRKALRGMRLNKLALMPPPPGARKLALECVPTRQHGEAGRCRASPLPAVGRVEAASSPRAIGGRAASGRSRPWARRVGRGGGIEAPSWSPSWSRRLHLCGRPRGREGVSLGTPYARRTFNRQADVGARPRASRAVVETPARAKPARYRGADPPRSRTRSRASGVTRTHQGASKRRQAVEAGRARRRFPSGWWSGRLAAGTGDRAVPAESRAIRAPE